MQVKTVTQLASEKPGAQTGCCLHYNGPGSTGFGVKRTAMLLPESAMLMVAPMGCGRSGTVVAQKFGFEDRMFYLNLDDRSVASGAYLREIGEAVRYIADLHTFQVVLICMTCIDALTGTDLEGLGRKISRETGIPVTTTFMDPIVRDGNLGPMVQVRKAITACFRREHPAEDAVNILGTFAPVAAGSELHRTFARAGIAKTDSVAGCKTFAELQEMGNARLNLVIHPQAAACGTQLQKTLGMPFVNLFTTYNLKQIKEDYQALEQALGCKLCCEAEENAARAALSDFSKKFAGRRIAVGEAVCGSPFDIAAVLLSCGIEVPFVFRSRVPPADRPALARLCAVAPELPVYSGTAPETFTGALPEADAVLGLDAGYFCPEAVSIAYPCDETVWGFEAAVHLTALLENGMAHPQSHRAQMHGTYLTV